MKRKPKILLFDVETAPSLGYVWGKWEQNVIDFEEHWYMLCYAAKWLGEKTFVKALPDYPGYKKNKESDKKLIKDLWELFNEADIIIAHNGDKFDIKKANARFSFYGLQPPTPYKTVDTVKVARKYFAFESNKLDDLSNVLGFGRKINTGGFELWKGCMEGDPASWRKMKKYNRHDVDLLEKVYLHFRPWIESHPNVSVYLQGEVCGRCGSDHLQSRGFERTNAAVYRRFQCQDCGGWGRLTKAEPGIKKVKNT